MKPTAVLHALQALCQQGLAADTLVPALLEALHGLVPSCRNLFDWTDAQGRLLRYYIEGPIDVALARLYFDEFHNRREAEAMLPFQALSQLPAGVRSQDDLQSDGFYESALYHEIWRPQGFHSRLEAVLRGPGGRLLGSLVLYRGPGEAAFSANDVWRLGSLLPMLARTLEADLPGQADEPHVPAPDPAETLLLTPDGQICHASAGAWRWLLMAGGGASRDALSRPALALGGPLLPQVLAGLQGRSAPGSAPARPLVISLDRPAGRFVVTGQRLQAMALPGAGSGQAGDPPQPLLQLSLRRHEPHRVALERALRSLPVTPGQMAVCRALYQGQAQAGIGQRLGVAASTVVDHVRKAYRALDLNSAHELRALLDQRIALTAGG